MIKFNFLQLGTFYTLGSTLGSTVEGQLRMHLIGFKKSFLSTHVLHAQDVLSGGGGGGSAKCVLQAVWLSDQKAENELPRHGTWNHADNSEAANFVVQSAFYVKQSVKVFFGEIYGNQRLIMNDIHRMTFADTLKRPFFEESSHSQQCCRETTFSWPLLPVQIAKMGKNRGRFVRCSLPFHLD